jgi:hypothetical protein
MGQRETELLAGALLLGKNMLLSNLNWRKVILCTSHSRIASLTDNLIAEANSLQWVNSGSLRFLLNISVHHAGIQDDHRAPVAQKDECN